MRNVNVFQTRTVNKIVIVLLVLLGGLLLSSCNREEEPEVYRVGILSGLNFLAANGEGFKEGMAELGYVEDENIIYDVQATDFDMDTYRSILQQFIEDEVDLIFVFPTEASVEAKIAVEGTDVPVVFGFSQIEELDLVDSIREPGGNVTGVRYPGPDLAIRRLEIMQQMVPGVTRVWIPFQRGYPIVEPQLKALRPAAEAAGVTLIEAPADNAAELESMFEEMIESGDIDDIDAFLFLAEPLAVTPDASAVLVRYAEEHQIPMGGIIFSPEGYSAIFGVNVDPYGAGFQAAPIADKILQGVPAGSIPVISADQVLEINFKQAQELGLEVPDELLAMAVNIIR
jgi:putative ABC transport system substrate-binding protein